MLKARELDSAELNSEVKDLAGDGYCGMREKCQSRVKLKRTAITCLLIGGKAGRRSRQKVARSLESECQHAKNWYNIETVGSKLTPSVILCYDEESRGGGEARRGDGGE